LPAVDDIYRHLSARIPEQGAATIVHGDYRLDNCMVDAAGDVVAVLDWEICTLGDPMADVGLLEVYWSGPHDAVAGLAAPATAVEGFLDRNDVLARYAAASGRDLSRVNFYVAFAYWKLACIVEGVYARYLNGAMGADKDPSTFDHFRLQVERSAENAAALCASIE
jgi:aminoglycoside phosphotransferase (APT) family kinase protein